jgi:hypothetical protein
MSSMETVRLDISNSLISIQFPLPVTLFTPFFHFHSISITNSLFCTIILLFEVVKHVYLRTYIGHDDMCQKAVEEHTTRREAFRDDLHTQMG